MEIGDKAERNCNDANDMRDDFLICVIDLNQQANRKDLMARDVL